MLRKRSDKLVYIMLKNNELIPGKLIERDKNDLLFALGRLGKFDFIIDDNKSIKWGNEKYNTKNNLPIDDINLLQRDIFLKLNRNRLNIDYTLRKRDNDYKLNDLILLKIKKENIKKSLNENIQDVSSIKDIDTNGLECKIININLWEPSPNHKIKNKEFKIVPGSFIVIHSKTQKKLNELKIKEIDTNPSYKKNTFCDEFCIFDVHFRDIDLVFNIKKIKN